MCDLDRFKLINDTFGHATGDVVIKKFSEISAGLLWPNDLFGRIRGEEFAVVFPRTSLRWPWLAPSESALLSRKLVASSTAARSTQR
jgi:diguanylate cyclase (GGDEF)-like protein